MTHSILRRNGTEIDRVEGPDAFRVWSRTYQTKAAREHAWYEIELWDEEKLLSQQIFNPDCCD